MGKFIFAVVLIIVLIVVGCVACSSSFYFNDHEITATVTDKERVANGDSSKYLIYTQTEDGETLVLENTDILVRGKFDSSDLYAEIKPGQTYKFSLVGKRVGIMSWYENILKATPI